VADLELFCNSWSVGFLGERLYRKDTRQDVYNHSGVCSSFESVRSRDGPTTAWGVGGGAASAPTAVARRRAGQRRRRRPRWRHASPPPPLVAARQRAGARRPCGWGLPHLPHSRRAPPRPAAPVPTAVAAVRPFQWVADAVNAAAVALAAMASRTRRWGRGLRHASGGAGVGVGGRLSRCTHHHATHCCWRAAGGTWGAPRRWPRTQRRRRCGREGDGGERPGWQPRCGRNCSVGPDQQ